MIRIRPMTTADIALGMRLKEQAGWNQTEADWRRCLALEPAGCFVAAWNGTPAGTTTTCIFGSVAWVAMVLVETSLRGRGVGKTLMEHALAFLDGAGVRSVRLDATALGQPLYDQLGFVTQFPLTRYEGSLPAAEPTQDVETARPDQFAELLRLDRAVTGTDRRRYLEYIFGDDPSAIRVVNQHSRVVGFSIARRGSRAIQLGVLLTQPDAGPRLFADACHHHRGRHVYVDIPAENAAAADLVRALGLTPQRQLMRMGRGPLVQERIPELWASSGPEKG
jgi:GNAT superfamily N-acetyltransferase